MKGKDLKAGAVVFCTRQKKDRLPADGKPLTIESVAWPYAIISFNLPVKKSSATSSSSGMGFLVFGGEPRVAPVDENFEWKRTTVSVNLKKGKYRFAEVPVEYQERHEAQHSGGPKLLDKTPIEGGEIE